VNGCSLNLGAFGCFLSGFTSKSLFAVFCPVSARDAEHAPPAKTEKKMKKMLTG
jgi:hypothetical protein